MDKISNIAERIELSVLEYGDKRLQDVMLLGKKYAKTLGMFPEGAYIEHVKKRCIIIATCGEITVGYLLFRVSKSNQVISIVHVCVDLKYRKSGVGGKLLDFIKTTKRAQARGISLFCRRDFVEACRFYKKNGFVQVREKRSRSKAENFLVKWYFDFANEDLFTQGDIATRKLIVLLDVCVLVKLRDSGKKHSEDLLALTADWLQNEVAYYFAQETLNEISNDQLSNRAKETKVFLSKFEVARPDPSLLSRILKDMDSIMTWESQNDLADKKQVAECIAANLDCFVTIDKKILSKAQEIQEKFSILVLTPSEFVLYFDQYSNRTDYRAVRLAGANFDSGHLKPKEILKIAEIFVRSNDGERKKDIENIISTIVLKGDRAFIRVIRNHGGEILGLIVAELDGVELRIHLLRTVRSRLAKALFSQMLTNVLNYGIQLGISRLIFGDSFGDIDQKEVLRDFHFVKSGSFFMRYLVNGVMTSQEALMHPSIAEGANLNTELIQIKSEASSKFSSELKYEVERSFWPLKLSDLDIPVYIIPIKPYWASQLFDHYQSEQDLFGANAQLIWQNENVYYRSAKPVTEKVPARILWYISSNIKRTTGREKGIVACSYLQEVAIGKASELYKRYKNYGVYEWSHVRKMVEDDLERDIKVLKFASTEVFRNIVRLEKVNELLRLHGRPHNTFTSPLEVSSEIFFSIYKIGNRH